MNLQQYGWSSDLEPYLHEAMKEGTVIGRVLLEHKKLYRVITPLGEVLASISGKFRFEAISESFHMNAIKATVNSNVNWPTSTAKKTKVCS